MDEHIYGYIRADLFPMNRLHEIKRIFKFSNMPNWNFIRKESEDDIEGTWYVGFEQDEKLNEEQLKLIDDLGIVVVGDSNEFNKWLTKYDNI